MIDYKDLKLGNWVYLTEKSKYPMQVVGIGDSYCYLNFKGNEADPFDGVDKDMMPIGIDDILLMKIGFIRSPMPIACESKFFSLVNDCYIEIRKGVSNSNGREWYCQIDNNRRESIGGFDFQYLHELQNGIRLITKGELEIKKL